MGKRSKKLGAPIGVLVDTPEVDNTVEVITPMPPMDEARQEPPSDGYNGGMSPNGDRTPEYIHGESPAVPFGGHQSSGEEEENVDPSKKDSPGPAPRAPFLHVERSGPLVPSMVPGYEHFEEDSMSSRRKSERSFAPTATPNFTPNRARLDPEDLDSIKMAINSRYNNSIQESDNRSMILAMQTQLANVFGAVQQIQTEVSKISSQCSGTHDHTVALRNLSKHGFEKLEDQVLGSRNSQGKNRAAIAENNASIGAVVRDMTEVKGTLRDIVRQLEPGARPVANQVQDPWGRGAHAQRPVDAQPPHPVVVQPQRPLEHPAQPPAPMVPNVVQLFARPADQQAPPPRAPRQERPERPSGPTCQFCHGSHRALDCTVFPTWQSRRRMLLEHAGCFQCLKTNASHNGVHDGCKEADFLCTKCYTKHQKEPHRRRHHMAVCEQAKPRVQDENQPPVKKAKPNFYGKKDHSAGKGKPRHG